MAWVLALAVGAAVVGAWEGGFTDLHVYRYAGQAVLDGASAYDADDPVTGLPFTYPPFAAVLMVPLALLPGWLAASLWTGASAACLAGSVLVALRASGRRAPGWLVALLALVALGLEPVWQSLSFGQVNTVLMLAILVDVVRPERRWSGVLVGIAAGIKLTPLVFVALLVLVGRRTAACRAALAFAATVAIGYAAMPAGATSYWTDGLLDAGRVGPPALAHNQSLFGALTRLLDGPPSTLVWVTVAAPLALAVLGVGALCWRRGDRVLGTCLAALAMLLASPVSWSHHWVWAVPVAVALWERTRWAATAWTAVFVARPVVWPPWGEGRELGWGAADHLAGNAYTLAALALALGVGVGVSAAGAARPPARAPDPPRRPTSAPPRSPRAP
ncbi:glycosyltransferase 87 family protein [Nocardioides antri]|uniref:glycosyltransferase 87 family protein n=1 Tax=Nocardioides antri TaxID=2607659 RepID=UPI00165FDCE1|nr:glycosyltransferase 87 family protein [Nocardioides antri]